MLARQRRSGNTRREFGVRHRAHPGQSAVIPEDVAAELDVLASRVRRMSPPLASNTERFHEERSVIAHDLAELARRIAPRARRTGSPHDEHLGYPVTKALRLRWHHAIGFGVGDVQMARCEGGKKSPITRAPYQGIAAHLPVGRSVSGAQPPLCATDAAAGDRFLLARASDTRRSAGARPCCPQRSA